jgi:urease accessory protein
MKISPMRIFPAKPAVIVQSLPANVAIAELSGKEKDRLVLPWEERRWMRGRFNTEQGREIGIALPTGMQVEPGQILWIDSDWYLTMEAANEPLLAIFVADHKEAIRVAFEVGNLHFPLALEGEKLMVPRDSAMTQLLARLGIRCEEFNGPFQPIGKGNPHEW